jgi:hypothetical protein
MAGSDRSSGNIRSAGMRCPATDDPDQSTRDLAECPARSPDLCGKRRKSQTPSFLHQNFFSSLHCWDRAPRAWDWRVWSASRDKPFTRGVQRR